ncbi:hypothetical protein WH87_04815 [Devosia epidermidihirudinis]|uniref:Uncharacterized protein n=1 Tax=Devosia epidermidihirudinis TaxID=1293439 RepID=A0A0F5QFM0_9HYPH|nr:hypothetical protein [Devosia epidermidihirudinis]KKC39518.1 hypothetical protein WH87_04815 [Devosia epidermidihirudinis]
MTAGEIMSLFEGQDEILAKMDVVRHLSALLCGKLEGRFSEKDGKEDAGRGYVKLLLSASEVEQICWLASEVSIHSAILNEKVDAAYSLLLVNAEQGRKAA